MGKTWFTCRLVRHWRALGHDAVGLKPISAGGREDAELLRAAATEALTLDAVNPVHLREPAAPLVAAQAEQQVIDFNALNRTVLATASGYSRVAVEGVGGWRVPLAPGYEVRDWARDLGLPVVVVARAGLGTLNHTLLTVDSIRATGLTCAGIVLNPGAEPSEAPSGEASTLARRTNGPLLQDLLGLPVFQVEGATARQIPLWLGGE